MGASIHGLYWTLTLFLISVAKGMEIGDMMPETCRKLMNSIHKNDTDSHYTEEQRSASDVGELTSYCPSKSALIVCISENLYEMRESGDPIQWGLSVMFEAKHVLEKSTITCRMFEQIKVTSQYRCLDVTKSKRDQCKATLENNLVYLRQNMDSDAPTAITEHTVCSAFYEFVVCQEHALKGFCDTSIMHLLAFSNTMFAFTDCKNPEKAVEIHQLVLNQSAIAKCGLQDMTFYWTGQNDVDFSRLYNGVSKSCARLDTIQNCLVSRFSTPNNHIDRMASERVNVDTIIDALHIMCRSYGKLKGQEKCLEEVNSYGSFCIMFIKGTYMAETILTGHDLLHCSHFRDLVRCMSTQIRRCDADLARDFSDAYMLEIESNKKCSKKSFPSGQLAGSSLVHCGAALAAKSVEASKKIKESLISQEDTIGSLLDFACDEVKWYMQCITPSLKGKSENKLDQFMRSIVHLDDTSVLEKAIGAVCEHKAPIKRNLPCLISKKQQFTMCVADYVMSVLADMNNLTSVQPNSNGVKLVCDQIHKIVECAVNVIRTCDDSLGSLAHDIQHDVIRYKGCGQKLSSDPGSGADMQYGTSLIFLAVAMYVLKWAFWL